MGAWGIGLYASDFAADLRAAVRAAARLPLDEDKLVEAICAAEEAAAKNPADEDHTVFWLVLADQFEKRGIFSARVRDTARAIIDGGKDAEMMGKLGIHVGLKGASDDSRTPPGPPPARFGPPGSIPIMP